MKVGDTHVPASSVRFATDGVTTGGTNTEPPHMVGQDTREVLAAAGFSEAELEGLEEERII